MMPKPVRHPRDPLTLRLPRSLQETRRDPYAWWEGPAEPQHILAFKGAMRPPRRGRRRGALAALRRIARALLRWLRAPSPWERRP